MFPNEPALFFFIFYFIILFNLFIFFFFAQMLLLFPLQGLPFDISVCMFVLEQALSVRALQEMVSAKTQDTVSIFSFLLWAIPHFLGDHMLCPLF